jgi:hypothetical protein
MRRMSGRTARRLVLAVNRAAVAGERIAEAASAEGADVAVQQSVRNRDRVEPGDLATNNDELCTLNASSGRDPRSCQDGWASI